MKFTKIGRTMGDETTPFKVTDYNAKTVVEFINEAIERNENEWGRISVKEKDFGFLFCKSVEYRYGELLDEIPDEWQYREIESVEAVGGWSNMDYNITPKHLT